jgi:uncharacterized protein DUF2442
MGAEGMRAVAEKNTLDVVVCDDAAASAIGQHDAVRLIKKWRAERASKLKNVFVLCSAMRLPEVADFVSSVNRQHRLRALFVRQDTDPAWLPQLLERANLRTVRNMLVHGHSDYSVPMRVLSAWELGRQDELIANATVVDNRLLLLSCALDNFEVPFDALPALRKIPPQVRRSFVISEEGSYIHWPEPDIHLDLDAFKSAIDPAWRVRASAIRLSQNRRYGEAIASVRKRYGLRQGDIPGLSGRQLRRIEGGKPISSAALRSLAEAHQLSLDEYLSVLADAANKAETTT